MKFRRIHWLKPVFGISCISGAIQWDFTWERRYFREIFARCSKYLENLQNFCKMNCNEIMIYMFWVLRFLNFFKNGHFWKNLTSESLRLTEFPTFRKYLRNGPTRAKRFSDGFFNFEKISKNIIFEWRSTRKTPFLCVFNRGVIFLDELTSTVKL
mgnify:CR=1 FL=1